MRSMLNAQFYYFLLLSLSLFGCNGEESQKTSSKNLSGLEGMRFDQYMVYGQKLYAAHCSNCHQDDGTGLGRVIPPLVKADYMLEDINHTVCVIKHGLNVPIWVNGKEYQQKMPANEELTALEIAQITTYVGNSWGNNKGYISVKEVDEYLKYCN